MPSPIPGRVAGLATTAELLNAMTRKQLDAAVRRGRLIRVWHGVYSTIEPDLMTRLCALDLVIDGHAVACLHTAATLYGFGVHDSPAVHVLDPGNGLRSTTGLVVHRREGAPLQLVSSLRATAPAWTAVEVARQVPRPRALATLDAALHSRRCTPAGPGRSGGPAARPTRASSMCATSWRSPTGGPSPRWRARPGWR